MAVDAGNLDGVARLAVELSVAVAVLFEVAVDAVHAAFEMDVLQVHGQPARFCIRLRASRLRRPLIRRTRVGVVHGRGELLRRGLLHDVARAVEQIALAIALEHGAEQPSMTVEVREARLTQRVVECQPAGLAARNSGSLHRPRSALPSGFLLFDRGPLGVAVACTAPADTSGRRRSRCPTT